MKFLIQSINIIQFKNHNFEIELSNLNKKILLVQKLKIGFLYIIKNNLKCDSISKKHKITLMSPFIKILIVFLNKESYVNFLITLNRRHTYQSLIFLTFLICKNLKTALQILYTTS